MTTTNDVRTAIDESFNQDRIVHLTWSQDAEDALRVECDDSAENGSVVEFWGDTGEQAWWHWHDADQSRWYATTAEADAACAAWLAGTSDVGPSRSERGGRWRVHLDRE